MFDPRDLELLQSIIERDLLKYLWETLYMTVLPTLFAFLIGLPLGVLLVTGDEDGVAPLPRWLMRGINAVINLLRSVPFLILLVIVLPLSRLLAGTTVGSRAMIAPLSIAAFPFVARLTETSFRAVDHGVVEAALSMGASPGQIVRKVLIPEALPALIANFTVSLITVFGYGAMAGAVGGGGLGNLAITYGYYRRNNAVLLFSVVLLILLVQIFQSLGNRAAAKTDKRRQN